MLITIRILKKINSMKINAYYSSDIKQHKFRLQYHKYQIHLTFVETMEINGGIFSEGT